MKERIVELLLPYFDFFSSCEIADQIIVQYKTENRQKFEIKIGHFQILEIRIGRLK